MRQRILDVLTAALLARRATVVTLIMLLALLAAVWGSRTLQLDADTDSLIGESHPFLIDFRDFKREFGDLQYLIVVVDAKPAGAESARHAEAKGAVLALVEALRSVPDLNAIHGFISADEQLRLAPWSRAMSEAELAGLVKATAAFAPMLERRSAASILARAEQQLDRLLPTAPASATHESHAQSDTDPSPDDASSPAKGAPLDRDAKERLGAAAFFALHAIAAGVAGGDPDFALAVPPEPRFLSMPDPPHELGRFLFVTILPQKEYGSLSVIEEPLERIREVMARVQRDFPDVEIGLTGKPVLQADEMMTTHRDMTRAAIAGVVLVALLFMLVFRGVRRPLLAVLVFGVGAALTYGAAALLVGRLNLLSLVFMLVLVGLGLDYGIHMVARYTEGVRRMSRRGAIRHMMRRAVPSNATGALIAGGTFLLALLTPFQGLRELGVIAGVGLLICMVTMALLMPVLLSLFDDGRHRAQSFIMGRAPGTSAGVSMAEEEATGFVATRHVVIAVVALVGAVTFALVGPRWVRFETNLLKLQADSVDAVKWEKRILEEDASETWFGAVVVDEIDDIPSVVERATAQPAIGSVRSVLDLVALPTPSRSALMVELGRATTVTAPAVGPAAPTTDTTTSTPPTADSNASEPTAPGALLEAGDVRRVATKVDGLALLAAIAAPDESKSMRALATRLRALGNELDPAIHDEAMIDARRFGVDDALRHTARALAQMGIGARGTLREALPAALRDEFTSRNGRFCVRLHPKADVWEFTPMQSFVAAMRRVDPRVTGIPVTQYESMLLLDRSFLIQSVASAFFVALILFLDLRSLRETLACLLALGAGLAWTLGFMALVGVNFNLANFFGVPIALGLGSDACIHIAHRAREGLTHGFGSTRRAVMVTAFTTVIGFGGLLFASHRGLYSLGVLMVASTLAMMVAATLLLPALLRIAARLRSAP